LSNLVFFNLNFDDIIVDQDSLKIKKGLNHISAMLKLDPKERINSNTILF